MHFDVSDSAAGIDKLNMYGLSKFQIRKGFGRGDRGVPPYREANRYPVGSDVHLGCLGARGFSRLGCRGRCKSGDASHWRNTKYVWIGAEISVAL